MPALHPWTPVSLAARSAPQLCPPSWRPADGDGGLRALLQPERAGGERSRFVPYVAARQEWNRLREDHGRGLAGPAVWDIRLRAARWIAGLVRLDAPGVETIESVEPWAVQDRQRLLEALRTHCEIPLARLEAPADGLHSEPFEPGSERLGPYEVGPASAGIVDRLGSLSLQVIEGGAVWRAAQGLLAALRPRERVRAEEFAPVAIALHEGAEPLPAGLLAWPLDDWRPA